MKLVGQDNARISPTSETRFYTEIRPNQSLNDRTFFWVVGGFGLASFGLGIGFIILGAWPVFGFFGVDIILVYIAFRRNYRSSERYETLNLSRNLLLVEQINSKGNRLSKCFHPYWLVIEFNEGYLTRDSLYLRSHGKSLEIARFLSTDRKKELADQLRAEIKKLKNEYTSLAAK